VEFRCLTGGYEALFGRVTSSTRSVSHVEEVASIRLDQESWEAAGSTPEATPARPRCVVGLVARSGPRGRGLFGYFFDLRSDEVPELSDLPAFTAKAAVLICRFGDFNLINGKWRILAALINRDRTIWPGSGPPLTT
jgi:hypothetical protein